MSWMLFILSYMKGGAAGTWVTHKIQQVLNPSGTLMTMDKFEAEVDLMFTDPNREATAQQKLSTLQQGTNSVNELIQQFKVHGPMSRLGDVGLVHHFEQVLNSRLRESIYRLCPMPRTWVEWKHETSILDNQWRRFNATCPQMTTSKNPATSTMTPMHSTSLHSILYLLTHAPHPQQQTGCRPATHGLGLYKVQEPTSDLLQLQQAGAHCLELSGTLCTLSVQHRPLVSSVDGETCSAMHYQPKQPKTLPVLNRGGAREN